VWECILPINIPRTFYYRSIPLPISFLYLLLPHLDHFQVRMHAAFQVRAACVRACVRALAILRVGMATDVT